MIPLCIFLYLFPYLHGKRYILFSFAVAQQDVTCCWCLSKNRHLGGLPRPERESLRDDGQRENQRKKGGGASQLIWNWVFTFKHQNARQILDLFFVHFSLTKPAFLSFSLSSINHSLALLFFQARFLHYHVCLHFFS